ncbi:MAG TPA: PLP-dependent aspartate aminotransferase family protein [Gemmatimonadales bacterium]|jgi:cystathionine beta-lyase/cystathionine gamma-synthase|nr:PLP-dependent aspartate aminotransferase family protein [Gemmatimonadales bacterium]
MTRRHGLSTLAIHGRPRRGADWSAAVTPIYQSTTFRNPIGGTEDVLYTRYGNNPNQAEINAKYALLEGAERAIFVSSGMAATALAHLAVLAPGDHLVSSRWIYGGTRVLFDTEFVRHGIEVTYVDPDHPREWRKALRKNTRAVFVESLTNPNMRLVDVPAIAKVTHDRGIALLVDSTFASPINFRPLEHGADVVITSATKYLNGHSDVIAGAVAGTASFVEEVTRLMRSWGPSIDPHAAWLIERGMKTLSVRVERANTNAMAVAEWASGRSEFSAVHYPGLKSHPDHKRASQLMDGYGGMVGLVVKGGARAAQKVLTRLKVIVHAPSLGGVESLVSEPRLTSHKALSAAERAALGVPDGFLRLSCGCEDAADLIGDLAAAV